MTFRELGTRYLPEENAHYARLYPIVFLVLILTFIVTAVLACVVWYFLHHKPVPPFYAVQKTGEKRVLYASREPNLLSSTIIRFATQALVRAYNFAPIGNEATLAAARPYFTSGGFSHYMNSVSGLIQQVEQNKLFAYGVVNGTALIANQGELPKRGYTWRVQIPFLATFMSAEQKTQHSYIVTMTIVRVPTYIHPQGIGIDEFYMVSPNANATL
jgi:hypothetical protein